MYISRTICFAVLFIGILTLASEPNVIESSLNCPEDSTIVDGICKCDYDLCKKPECEDEAMFLNLSSNSSDLPGFCCPTYTCLKCLELPSANETSGKCSCAQDAFFNEFGKCECEDPHKTLQDDVCVCDVNKCELPHLCNETSVPVKVNDGCCSNVKCLPCPADSYSKSYHSDDIEDICVCFPCPEPKCNEIQTLVTLRKGKNIPGMCCDLYKCEDKNTTEKICKVEDTSYAEGGTWITSDKDNCTCQNGVSLCDKNLQFINASCFVGDAIYPHLHTWLEDEDACTNCTCYNGRYKCVAHMCDVNISVIKAPQCPSMANCKKSCDLGFKIKKGCEICKCKAPSKPVNSKKYPLLETFMERLNISENETVLLLHQQLENINNANSFSVEVTTSATTALTSPPSTSVYIYGATIDTESWYATVLIPIVTFFFGFFFCCVIACAFHFFKNNSYKYAPVKKPIKNNTITDSYRQKNLELQTRPDVKYVNEKIPLT